MPGIGIITNPHSRRNRRYPEQMRRLGYVLGQNDAYEMTNRVEDVEHVARKFLDDEIEILALNGGDGTNHATLGRFIKVYGDHPLPKIALLRGGTMNTVANGVGVRGTPSRLLANLVEKYYTRQPFETTERDMLSVRDEHGTYYGFIFGNGIISNFLELYYAAEDPSPWVATKLLSQGMVQIVTGGAIKDALFRPFRAKMEFDTGTNWPDTNYQAVLAGTVAQIGLGFRPFIRCEERKGAFHILGAHSDALTVLSQLHRVRLGLPVSDTCIYSEVASKVTFTSDKQITYTIDGEMHTSLEGYIELLSGPRVEIILK